MNKLAPAAASTPRARPRILVVDDEPDALELIGRKLEEVGMTPVYAHDGPQAIELAREGKPELIVLDLSLPEMDGLDVCRALRQDPETKNIPILMLSGRATELDRIVGLELGASDYVTKPFSPRELMLRIKNLLRRAVIAVDDFEGVQVDGLELNVPLRSVLVYGRAVDLTPTEFNLFVELARNRGRVQTRERLLQRILGYDDSMKSRTVDTHINRLQKKLGRAAHYIECVRFLGYMFSAPPQS